MKRFALILLALGLVAAFSTTVFALDVKFSGEYYAAGMYLDKTSLNKDSYLKGTPGDCRVHVSTAFFIPETPGENGFHRIDGSETDHPLRCHGADLGRQQKSGRNDAGGGFGGERALKTKTSPLTGRMWNTNRPSAFSARAI